MRIYSKLLIIVAGVLGMLVLTACSSSRQAEPVEGPVQAPVLAAQPDAITPTSEPTAEVAPRAEGDVIAESTLGFDISGWS